MNLPNELEKWMVESEGIRDAEADSGVDLGFDAALGVH